MAVAGMICAGYEPGHCGEVERRSPVAKFIDIHRHLIIQELHDVMHAAGQARVCSFCAPLQLRARIITKRILR